MKKARIWCAFFIGFLLFFGGVAVRGAVDEATGDAADRVAGELAAWQAAIPPEVAEFLPDGVFSSDVEEIAAGTKEAGALRTVFSVIGRLTGLTIKENLSLLAAITGVLLLSALFRAFSVGKSEGVGRALTFFVSLSLAFLLLSRERERFLKLNAFFSLVGTLGGAMLPLTGALYAMGGNVRAAAVNNTVMTAFLSILETLIGKTVLPVAGIALAFALIDALTNMDLRSLGALIKRTYTLCFSFLMLLLCGVLGIQTTLARAEDSLALRTARFAAGSFLPVVGGSVSEALRTVAASVGYLRGVVGAGGIVVLFFAFLPTFLSVALTRITFLLSGAVARLLGCNGEEKILAELGSVYGYFLAVIASLFVMMTFSLSLFARCASA